MLRSVPQRLYETAAEHHDLHLSDVHFSLMDDHVDINAGNVSVFHVLEII